MADTLKQVRLDRQRMIENNQRATESSRAALSAISGRNVLKTKTEVERLRRNEEIAKAQNEALRAVQQSTGNVALEKAKLSKEQHGESLALSRERLDLSRNRFSLSQQEFDHQKIGDRQNEILSMLNMGIYEPSFAMELQMPEDVVRQAAANRKAKLDADRVKKAAAEKAKADYEAILQNRGMETQQKTLTQKSVEKAIDEAEKGGMLTGTAQETKIGILATAKNNLAGSPLSSVKNNIFDGNFTLGEIKEIRSGQPSEKTNEEIRRNQEISDHYDRTVTERIYRKEKEGKELSPLESAFKTENETSLAYSLRMKRFEAVDKMETAVTAEEMNTAYNEYLSILDNKRSETINKVIEVQDLYQEKSDRAEKFTAEERAEMEALLPELQELKAVISYEIEKGGLTAEGKKVLQTELENIENAIAILNDAVDYDVHYEENEDGLVYREMEEEYGNLSVSDIEAMIAEYERRKEDTSDLRALLAEGRRNSTEELVSARERLQAAEAHNADIEKELAPLRAYLEQRRTLEENAQQDVRASEDLVGAPGETLTQKTLFLIGEIEESNKQSGGFEVSLPNSFWKWSKEQKCNWFNETYGTAYSPEEFDVNAAFSSLNPKKFKADAVKDLTGYFHRHIVAHNEGLFGDAELAEYADEAVKEFDTKGFYAYTGDLIKYKDGIDGLYEGDYSDFRQDMVGFIKGEYGYFAEKEAKTVLALMVKYGTEEAFVHYAAVRDEALKREAKEFTGLGRVVRGVSSGLTQFLTNGGEMLENAFTGQYSRIAGTLGIASHQLNMEGFAERTGIGDEALETLYMTGYSIFDMLPAVALGAVPYVGGALSSAYTFAKVTATTYNESIQAGKRADEALTYSLLSATAEVGLEKILSTGGQTFAKSGAGKVWKEAVENLASTKAMQVIVKTAGSMGSEGFEEFLQECLSPFMEKVAADLNGIDDATLKEIDWEEAAKSFAIGALTGGVFGGFEAITSSHNYGMKEGDAEELLKSGKVVEVIHAAAELGNKRALVIKEALQNNQTLYEGKEGYFAYASPADVINMIQSTKRRSYRQSLELLSAQYAERNTDPTKQRRFSTLFKKILQGTTLSLQETAEIINDAEMSGILSDLLGMDVVKMLPDRVRAVTKLAAFSKGGKISKERVNLFRDVFGEIDADAIATIMKYGDMAAKKGAGILFEDADAETNLTEAEQESVEVLKILSPEVGTVFYVTDEFETGTYLSANMMAVRPGDLAGGVFKSATHRAYYMAKQMMADRGVDFKAFLLGEAKRLKGESFVEEQIKTILRQSAENGNDISRPTAENELCARLLGELLQQDGVLEKLAESNIESVAALRKALAAVEDHIVQRTLQHTDATEYADIVDNIANDPNYKTQDEFVKICEETPKILVDKANAPKRGMIIKFNKLYGLIRKDGNDPSVHYHNLGPDFAKNIFSLLGNPEKILLMANGRLNVVVKYTNAKGDNVIFSVELDVEKQIAGHFDKYNLIVTGYGANDSHEMNNENKPGTIVLYDKKSGTPQVKHRAANVSAIVNDVPLDNSIPNSSENVNTDSEFSFFDGGSEEVTDLVDRMTALINGEKKSVEKTDVYPDRDPTYTDAEQVRAENGGADSARNFEDMTPEERAAEIADLQSEIDAIMTEDIQKQLKREEGERKSGAEGMVDRVGAHKEQKKDPPGKWIGDSWNWIRRRMVDSGQAIYDIGKKIKDDYLYAYYNMARAAQQAGVTMISKWQTDVTGKVIGKSLQEIWAPIKDQGTEYAKQFDLYLLHLHNIDRMSRYDPEALAEARHQYEVEKAYLSEELQKMSDNEIRAISYDRDSAFVGEARDYINALNNYNRIRNVRDKPVFGYDVSAEDSRGAVDDLERRYPEFKEYREAVYQYVDNLLQYRVDSGLISVETKALLKKTYPHYVPTVRVRAEDAPAKKRWWQREKNREQTNKVIGKAKGGDQEILSLYDQIAGQTMSVVREGSKNRLGVRLLDLALGNDTKKRSTAPSGADKIQAGMSDAERYEILKDRKIMVTPFNQAEYERVVAENPQLKDKKIAFSDAKKILKKLGDEFDVFTKYSSDDFEIEFEFGKGNLRESLHKQYGNYDIYAQMLSCFSDVVSNAVGIEVHNRNAEGYKPDPTLKNVYVLSSAFRNETDIIPVKLEVKEFRDKPNRLYVAVALQGIKNDRIMNMGVPNTRSHVHISPVTDRIKNRGVPNDRSHVPTSPINISVHELFSKINPSDKNFLKYVPKVFLTSKEAEKGRDAIPEIKRVGKYADKLTDPLLIDRHLDEIDPFMTVENKNIFGVFRDGEFWEMEVTGDLWEAIAALDKEEDPQNGFKKFAKWNVDTFKRLITSLNPIFAIRNPIKDIADGLFYSKETKRWLMAMPAAIREMKNGGELWQQYVALGGGFSTYFDFARMGTKDPKGIGKFTGRIEALNQTIEQFPRFAEFVATVRKGDGSMDNLMEAMLNAADITTNFGRSGSTGRMLNRYWIPFFNPSIQGMSKAVRAWTEQRSVKGFVALGAKAVFFGIAPAVINALLYRDDEEWEMIKQTDKDRYFLFKIKDGLWVRIPKGRMLSVFGGVGDRAMQTIDGDEFEWASLIQTSLEQMAPSNPIESNIFGPLFLASINRTWYGTEIVGDRLKNEPEAEQYDTKTDELSKWIGSVTGLSPKKVNYVLDAYGGIVGDVLLPALTPAAERSVFSQAFTLDTNYSNRMSGDFYDKLDELSDRKNSVKATVEDEVLYRWWNRNADTVSEINAEIRKIEEDASLDSKEKKEAVNEQYVIRNAAMLGFEENYDRYAEAVKKYSEDAADMSEEDAKEYIYREANREIFGAEYALKACGTSTYERAVKVQKEQGIDFDTFYDVCFDSGEPDVEKCFLLIEDGFEKEPALEIARNIGALEPLNNAKSVSAVQKYRAIDAADITEDEKLWAMSVLATDTDRRRLTVFADYNITLGQFVSVKDNVSYLNDNAEGGVTNAMVKTAIDDVDGLSDTQRAVFWQIFTGSSSAKNNPYSYEAGQTAALKYKGLIEAEKAETK